MKYDKNNKTVSLPNGLCKFENDLTDEERGERIRWLASFGTPLEPDHSFYEGTLPKETGERPVRNKKERLWCNTCKNRYPNKDWDMPGLSCNDYPVSIWISKIPIRRNEKHFNTFISEYIDSSCPGHEPIEDAPDFKWCNTCRYGSQFRERDKWQCDDTIHVNATKWRHSNSSAEGGFRTIDDIHSSCPRWKEKQSDHSSNSAASLTNYASIPAGWK